MKLGVNHNILYACAQRGYSSDLFQRKRVLRTKQVVNVDLRRFFVCNRLWMKFRKKISQKMSVGESL